jgi:hypothetical protein
VRQGGRGVTDEVHLIRVTHADHCRIEVDLHRSRLVKLRHELGIGKTRSDSEQRVGSAHHLVTWARPPSSPIEPVTYGSSSDSTSLPSSAFHSRAEQVRDLLQLSTPGPGTGQDRDPATAIEDFRHLPQRVGVRREFGPAGSQAEGTILNAWVGAE